MHRQIPTGSAQSLTVLRPAHRYHTISAHPWPRLCLLNLKPCLTAAHLSAQRVLCSVTGTTNAQNPSESRRQEASADTLTRSSDVSRTAAAGLATDRLQVGAATSLESGTTAPGPITPSAPHASLASLTPTRAEEAEADTADADDEDGAAQENSVTAPGGGRRGRLSDPLTAWAGTIAGPGLSSLLATPPGPTRRRDTKVAAIGDGASVLSSSLVRMFSPDRADTTEALTSSTHARSVGACPLHRGRLHLRLYSETPCLWFRQTQNEADSVHLVRSWGL